MAKVEDAQIVAAVISCRTNKEAAASLHMSESQLYERMSSTSYRDLLNATINAQLEGIAGNLRDKLLLAISVLSEVAADQEAPASIRVQAANSLIAHFCNLSKVSRGARAAMKGDKQDDAWDGFMIP